MFCAENQEGSIWLQTQDVLGLHRLVHFGVFSFAFAVDGRHSEEIVRSRFQVGHHVLTGLDLWVSDHPFLFFCVQLFQNVVFDFTATIVDGFLPAQSDGGLGGVHHTQL